MTQKPSANSGDQKFNQLLLIQTGSDLVSVLNLLTALEMQNSREPDVGAITHAAVRQLARYLVMPRTNVLLLMVWHEAAQTHVPYVSESFAARDEHAQTRAVATLLAKVPQPYKRVIRISTHGDPEPGLQDVIEMLCREALLEAK